MRTLRIFLMALTLAFLAGLLAPLTARDTASAGPELTLASAPVATGGLSFGLLRSQVRPVASYCQRDCEQCRGYCYNTYRVNCYDYGCRQAFSQCMKDCWNSICRNCGY